MVTRRKSKSLNKLDIRTVAERAEVSIATVSRTINSIPSVSPELSQRVWKAIEELNYYPNTQARSLVSGRSRIFGLIVPEITNPFFPELIQGFEDIAVKNGYEILISSTGNDAQRMSACIRRMLERKVEGVAVMTFGVEEPLLEQFAARRVPLVLAEFHLDNPLVNTLLLDYYTGIHQAVDHLVALGHKKIAFVRGPLNLHSAESRHQAFLKSMREAGVPVQQDWIIVGDHQLDGGVRAFEELMRRGNLPTAILCSNDMTAIGVLRAAHHAGLNVPRDLSVIGLDDIHFAEFTMPPLTTVRLSGVEIARAAFKALAAQVEKAASQPVQREYLISTSLVVRESTAPPRRVKK